MTMQIFVEYTDRNQKTLVRTKAKGYATEVVSLDWQSWFEPFGEEYDDDFTDWLEDQGISYEHV